MADTVKLRLDVLDVYGDRVQELVDIHLRHQTSSQEKVVRGADASKRILIPGLRGRPNGLYRLEVDAPAYLPVAQFVDLNASGTTERTVTLPINPKKVVSVDFPEYEDLGFQTLLENSDSVLGFEELKGEALYGALDAPRKAGLLNIAAKMLRTPLSIGKSVLEFVQVLHELRGDRFFATVPKELREETKNSVAADLFHVADQSQHHPPDGFPGFTNAGSFKTNEQRGNLQLSFFMKGDACLADIDIDDAAGLGHVFQVLRNTLSGRPTHPYDIHEILVFDQRIDPEYTFEV